MSPLPQGFVCYHGSSLEDEPPKGHLTFENGRGELVGDVVTVHPGSGLLANLTFRSYEHAAIAGVEVESMHKALGGMHRHHQHHRH